MDFAGDFLGVVKTSPGCSIFLLWFLRGGFCLLSSLYYIPDLPFVHLLYSFTFLFIMLACSKTREIVNYKTEKQNKNKNKENQWMREIQELAIYIIIHIVW